MAAVTFDKPQILLGFAGFIPLIIIGALHYHKYRPFLRFFISSIPAERDRLVRELKVRYLFSSMFFGIFLACIIIALAGPRWGRRIVMEYRRGADAVLALDLSRSMEVRDMPDDNGDLMTSRLDRAVRIALEMTEASQGIRFGAAIGKGRGVLAVPLTYDTETILSFFEGLSGSVITGKGTNLETLIDAAAGAFQNAFPTRRGIILFSDGESWSGSLSAALDRAIEAGITIITLGVGTETGGPVPPDFSPFSNAAEETPPPPVSYRRTEVLRNIAERTGGIYVDGNQQNAAELLAAQVRSLSPESGTRGYHLETQARWQFFVIIALLSLGASKLLEKKGRKVKRGGRREEREGGVSGEWREEGGEWREEGKERKYSSLHTSLSTLHPPLSTLLPLFFLLPFLLCSCSKIQGKLLIMEGNFFNSRGMYTEAVASYLKAQHYTEARPYAEFGLGSVYFSLDEGTLALERFAAAERSLRETPKAPYPELVYRLHYNTGAVRFKEGDYAGAAQSFRAALEQDGSRIEAKRNLELSLLSLAQKKTAPSISNDQEADPFKNIQNIQDQTPVLFEYLRQKEQNQWKSREWTEDSPFSGPDY